MKISKWEIAIALVLAALTGGLAALVPVEQPVRIRHVGYDIAAQMFVIQGANFVDPDHPAEPYVEIAGQVAEVLSYADDFLTARVPGLGGGDHLVHVGRRNVTTREGRVLGGASQEIVITFADALAAAVAEPAPARVARNPAR
jgi:hypothetical protein